MAETVGVPEKIEEIKPKVVPVDENSPPHEPDLNYQPNPYRLQQQLLSEWRQSMDFSPGNIGYRPNLSTERIGPPLEKTLERLEKISLPSLKLKALLRRVFRL